MHVDVLGLGQGGDGGGRGVDAALGLGGRHALDPVRAALELEHRVRAIALHRERVLAVAEQQAELAADRRSQVGTGDRAEKIRTYNYGERRVTDHRIKLTAHNLDEVLQGGLDEFTGALQSDDKRRRLAEQAAEA